MRPIYEMALLESLALTKIESVAVQRNAAGHHNLFVGTCEGQLLLYEIRLTDPKRKLRVFKVS